jgi:hypothetical protein
MGVDAARLLIEQRQLPRPSYTLDDGTEMVPPDYFRLYDEVGPDGVAEFFRSRLAEAAERFGISCDEAMLNDEYEGYLSGEYGVCLRDVTPETICAKGFHMGTIERLLEEPRPADDDWRNALAGSVDALDRLERQFAEFDRVRWGSVSRDRLVTAVRERYPEAFVQHR